MNETITEIAQAVLDVSRHYKLPLNQWVALHVPQNDLHGFTAMCNTFDLCANNPHAHKYLDRVDIKQYPITVVVYINELEAVTNAVLANPERFTVKTPQHLRDLVMTQWQRIKKLLEDVKQSPNSFAWLNFDSTARLGTNQVNINVDRAKPGDLS